MRHIACVALFCLASHLAAAAPADPVASVNGVPITRAEFEQVLARRGDLPADSASARVALRDRLIAEELVWQKAQQAGYANGSDRQAAIARYIAQAVGPRAITETELRARYEQVVATLGTREYRISLIQTADRVTLAKAQQALHGGAAFAQVASNHSRAPSAPRGGELDWVSFRVPAREGRTSGLPIQIARALGKMKPGEISSPIDLGDAWALVRLDAERATVVPRYDEVKPDLQRLLAAKAIEDATRELVVTLFKGAQIKVYE